MAKNAIRSITIIFALAASFSSATYLEYLFGAQNPASNLTELLLKMVFLGAFVIASYYCKISMNTVFYASLAITMLGYLLVILGVVDESYIMSGATTGIFLLGCAFSTFSIKEARRNIILGFACTVPVFLIITLVLPIAPAVLQRVIDILFFLLVTLFLFLTDETNKPFPSVRETTASYQAKGERWTTGIFAQKDSVLPMLPITLIFFFTFGMLEAYAHAKGIIAPTMVMMLVPLVICLILLWVNSTKRFSNWLNTIIFVIWALFLVSFSAILLTTDMLPSLFSVMSGAIVVVHIPLWIFLTKTSTERSVTPVFLYGVLTFMLFFFHVLGRLISSLLLDAFGLSAYNPSIIVAVAMTLVSLVIALLFVFMLQRNNMPPADRHEETFDAFCQAYKLSEREGEIVKLFSQGRSVRFISAQILISESTVRTHLQRAYGKLEIHDRQELLNAMSEFSVKHAAGASERDACRERENAK